MRTVNISDMIVSNQKDDVIITHSLGSCIGVTLYNPVHGIGGMLHALLPQAKSHPKKAGENPCMFVDSGFELLLKRVLIHPGDLRHLVCKVAGGGHFLDQKGVFKIGERNYTALRKILWNNKIMIQGEDVGGTIPRTMVLYMATGKTCVRTGGREYPI